MSYKTAFQSDRYKPQAQSRLFTAQVLNPGMTATGEAKPWGFAIEGKYAEQVNFSATSDDGWQYHPDYQFKGNEEPTPIYVCQAPRLVILTKGDVCLKDRVTNANLGFLRGSEHHAAYYANREAFGTYTRNLVFFVGEDNRLLHQHPLSLRLSGAASGTFNDEFGTYERQTRTLVGGFQFELLQAYAEALNQDYQEMGAEFFAYWIFSIQCQKLSKGTGTQSNPVCCTVSHAVPTVETLEDFYINPESQHGRLITRALEQYPNFGQYNASKPDQGEDQEPASAPKPKRRLPDVGTRPTVASASEKQPDEAGTVAIAGSIKALKTRHEPDGRGWLAVFSINPEHGEMQTCYAAGDIAHHIHQLYHNGSFVSLEATPILDRKGNPGLQVNDICAATPGTSPVLETPFDLGEILVGVKLELDRLGWSKRQGSEHLQKTYGKKTRAELTDDQMAAFLQYLRLQEAPAARSNS